MSSKGMVAVIAVFLAGVAAFIVYLSMAPEVAPPQAAARPQPVAPPPAPAPEPFREEPAPTPPPPPAPKPAPEPEQPKPMPETMQGDFGEIEGVVTKATVPVPNITLNATPDAVTGDVAPSTAVTDNLGRFKLAQVPAGKVIVRLAESAGWAGDVYTEVLVAKNEVNEIQIKLPASPATLVGVIHAGDTLLPGAQIELKIDKEQLVQTVKLTSTDGNVSIDKLIDGVAGITIDVERTPGNRRVKTESFGLVEGQTAEKDFDFAEPSRVSGTITGIENDQRTNVIALYGVVNGLESIASPQDVADKIARLTSPDSTGYYQLPGLAPGTYTIAIFSMRENPDDQSTYYKVAYHVVDLATEEQVALDLEVK